MSDFESELNRVSTKVDALEQFIYSELEKSNSEDSEHKKLIEAQSEAIASLKALCSDKDKALKGLSKWIVLAILGGLSLTVKYEFEYSPGDGFIIRPDLNAGMVIPFAYTAAIIAVATNQDEKVGLILEKLGDKLG